MDSPPGKIPRWFATRWAGVAVAALHCGVTFDEVWVAAQPALAGGVGGVQAGVSEIPARLDVTAAEAAAIVAFAGPMAEARARGWRVEEVARRDPQAMNPFREALAALAAKAPEGPEAPLEARISALAGKMYNTPKMWTGVNAVAGALQARRTLSFYEVVHIIDRLERDPTL